jgi:hypothetical protein
MYGRKLWIVRDFQCHNVMNLLSESRSGGCKLTALGFDLPVSRDVEESKEGTDLRHVSEL